MKTQEYKFTNEELFSLPEYQTLFIEAFGNSQTDEFVKTKIEKDRSNSKNYKKGYFYHATGGIGEIGLGEGLYLGKDQNAIHNFYNGNGEFGYIQTYKGNPIFLDLTLLNDYYNFEKEAIEKFGILRNKNHFKLATLSKGFDGIRYFDPITTGEEFVLYDCSKVKLITQSESKNEFEVLL